jgi:hypothetical protein
MRTQLVFAAAIATALMSCGFDIAVAAGEAPNSDAAKIKKLLDSTWIRASARHTEFMALTESGQSVPIAQRGGRGTMRGIAGSIVSADTSQPFLHDGGIKVVCDKDYVTVSARAYSVTVPAGASILMESFPSIQMYRVIALSAPSQKFVEVTFKKSRLPVRLASGEMVSTEGTDHPASPTKFHEKNFLDANPEYAPLLADTAATSAPSKLVAINGTEFKCMSSGVISLRDGELLIQCASPLAVRGPAAEAVAKKGALIDVEAYTGEFRVKSLSGPGHLAVQEGEQTLPINPGQELFITKKVIEDSDLTPPDGVGRRRFDKMTLVDGTKAVMSDFSILAFLAAGEHMQALRHSKDSNDHSVAERILKTAAAVQSLTMASGRYQASPRVSRIKKRSEYRGL